MMIGSILKNVCIAVIIAIIAVVVYKRHLEEELVLATVLSSLLSIEQQAHLNGDIRVAIGFGSCEDVISPGLDVLRAFGASAPDAPLHFDVVHDKDEFERVFSYFFQYGAAGERFTGNSSMFRELASIAKTHPATRSLLGGNAPVMMKRFLKEGTKVLLAAQMSDYFRKDIDPSVKIAGDYVEEDDIHLILEYNKGAEFGKYKSPRANRFIIHNDHNNPMLTMLEKFSEVIHEFDPHLLVISGLQMLDNFPYQEGQRRLRLQKLRDIVVALPRSTHVHFEMASFSEQDCLQDLVDYVVYYSNSLGMNEQELPNILSMLSNGSITLVSNPVPRVASTLDQMRELFRILRRTPVSGGMRKIDRLHVHTLAFQAIMVSKDSTWKNSAVATAKASLTANRHTCGSNSVDTDKARLLMDSSFSVSLTEGSARVSFQSEQPVSCWTEEDIDICIAPVLVCTEVIQTVGGGDNITPAGLVAQL